MRLNLCPVYVPFPLEGRTVGSRVILEIPPADGYGKEGNPDAGIKGTDTLFFVVDILGAS